MQNALSDYGDSTRLSSIHQIEQIVAMMNVYAQHKKSMEEQIETELNKNKKNNSYEQHSAIQVQIPREQR